MGEIPLNKNREFERKKRVEEAHWVPEKNAVTGFTFKGMAMLLAVVIIILVIKYFST